MWGTPSFLELKCHNHRITPTYVGNTQWPIRAADKLRDHPHVCGEHAKQITEKIYQAGSPPRMWGTPSTERIEPIKQRITPTYVGNTRLEKPIRMSWWDHPHVCGEHLKMKQTHQKQRGSPPRMWGTRLSHPIRYAEDGITPTYVGNTWLIKQASAQSKDHPHVCGEHFFLALCPLLLPGSPPRMWGTPSSSKTVG